MSPQPPRPDPVPPFPPGFLADLERLELCDLVELAEIHLAERHRLEVALGLERKLLKHAKARLAAVLCRDRPGGEWLQNGLRYRAHRDGNGVERSRLDIQSGGSGT